MVNLFYQIIQSIYSCKLAFITASKKRVKVDHNKLVLEDIASGPYYLQSLICCRYLTPQPPPIFFLQHLLYFDSLFNLQSLGSFPRNRVFAMLESAKLLTAINTLKKLQRRIFFLVHFLYILNELRENRKPLTCVFDKCI